MIKEQKVKIKINASNYNFYKDNFPNIKTNKIIEIDVDDLYPNSKVKIKVKCDICGIEKYLSRDMYEKNIKNGGYYSCSKKCSVDKYKKTSLNKYGVDNPSKSKVVKEKIKKTNLKKYGSESVFASKEIKEKIKKINLKNIGVEYPQQNKKIQKKKEKTNLKKYGYKQASKNKKVKKKIASNIKNHYNKKSYEIYKNLIDKKDNLLKIKCDKNHIFETTTLLYSNRKQLKNTQCTICNPIKNSSSDQENNFSLFINSLNSNILNNDKNIIKPYELDIYLPDLKLAFEFNGLYWHNELYKDKNYHLEKTELCEKNNIHLIHIYEDDWIYKQDIIKSMILNKLGKTPNKIYARKTEVKEINNNKLIREFLDNNHIQGFIGSKVKLGLFYNNELISLMTFGKRRLTMGKTSTNEDEYELLRFCNKLNTNVLGGASKLFKYFINNYNPKEITTYADRSHSNGNLYKQLGFKFQEKTQPNYYYVLSKKKYHRFNFRKNKLIKEGFNPNKTEHEIMLDRNIYRIYNSGNLKFIYP